ncbi:hypothetical protein Q9L58_001168 [Maublancomyces gigas]|uniref:Uncharacterized protein n=1 Tax=Discina gigas TaxID=1032678 RepID=A0ABR3GW78_9PEZI
MAAFTVRLWPAGVANHTLSDIAAAFGLSRAETQLMFASQAATDGISALAAWKAKFTTTQAPSLALLTEKNRVPAGQQPLGKLPEYLSLLEAFVDGSRNLFALSPNNPILIEDIRDAHRILSCASRQATRAVKTTVKASPAPQRERSTSVKAPLASGKPPSTPLRRDLEVSPPRHRPRLQIPKQQPEPVINKRVDLHVIWDNPPSEIPPATAQKFLANIQLILQTWVDFERWIKSNYNIASSGLQTIQYLAHTMPSVKPFTRFDLTDFDLAEDSWELALSAASRMGLLMVLFKTKSVVPPVSEPESTTVPEVPTVGAGSMVDGDGEEDQDQDQDQDQNWVEIVREVRQRKRTREAPSCSLGPKDPVKVKTSTSASPGL